MVWWHKEMGMSCLNFERWNGPFIFGSEHGTFAHLLFGLGISKGGRKELTCGTHMPFFFFFSSSSLLHILRSTGNPTLVPSPAPRPSSSPCLCYAPGSSLCRLDPPHLGSYLRLCPTAWALALAPGPGPSHATLVCRTTLHLRPTTLLG